ncbi:MAG: hypothetical protein M1831_000781 [Alyxoria varia]|nr:MAG: hypothetical protein M1831_000781 [Alyxoria varia]
MVMKMINIVMRALQFFFALLILALTGNMIAESIAGNPSIVNFATACAVIAMLSLFYLIPATIKEGLAFHPIILITVDVLNTLLWFCAAVALAAELGVHSCTETSYLVRWIDVSSGHTISWSIQPRKKSIHFGLFKHPGNANGTTLNLPSTSQESPADHDDPAARRSSAFSQSESPSIAIDKLEKLGMKKIQWTGKCEADRATIGRYDVPDGGAGMYGLVFDNTFSKQLSKTVTFVTMTYPTLHPPTPGNSMHLAQTITNESTGSLPGSSEKPSPNLSPHSDEQRVRDMDGSKVVLADPRPKNTRGQEYVTSSGGSFYTGILSKKRRKRNQGYARRFFSLDFTSSTLSYYKNRNSFRLRGAVPLSLAAVAADEKSRVISIDSGAEIWLLKAHGQQDFQGWKSALERASESASLPKSPAAQEGSSQPYTAVNAAEEREWSNVESLVGRVAGITDAVRRLAKDTDPKFLPIPRSALVRNASRDSPGSVEGTATDYFSTPVSEEASRPERKRFWKRKSSNNLFAANNLRNNVSTPKLAPPSPVPVTSPSIPKNENFASSSDGESHVHDNCMALLRDLDSVVAEFSELIAKSRQRRQPREPPTASSRQSIDSVAQEFFDAEDTPMSPVLTIRRDNEAEGAISDRDDAASIDSTSTISNADTAIRRESNGQAIKAKGDTPFFPEPPTSYYPLPHAPVARRDNVPPSKGTPPSLVAILRKNVGKDLSTITMPVTINEPLSLLQRQAEQLEYASLLHTASSVGAEESVSPDTAKNQRLLYVTAFALSSLSSARVRERAIRKPFNPMLGETFELVREDLGFRFIAEKVSHRPVRVASQAEGFIHSTPENSKATPAWTFTQAPAPDQKFWGKSAEIITDGRVRVKLHNSGECYSWTPAQCFLRNIIAGEKYVEPVGSMTIVEETSGCRAMAHFKSGGMFSGRSEDVEVEAFTETGTALPIGLTGKWTTELKTTDGHSVWRVGSLVHSAPARYGLTSFAATLNETTALEKGALPPTDSRLRPDQRAYEEGKVDAAETLKASLEEAQRRRRAEMQANGEEWRPRWFERVDGGGSDEVWLLKDQKGKGAYWDVREAVVGFKGGKWDGVREENYGIGSEANPAQTIIWPPEETLPGFHDFTTAIYWSLEATAKMTLSALAVGLEFNEAETTQLVQAMSGHNNQPRLLHYPPVEREKLERKPVGRIPTHQDWSVFTLDWQGEVGGLKLKDPRLGRNEDGGFVFAESVGKNGSALGAAPSRATARGKHGHPGTIPSRYSIPYLVARDDDAVIKPLQSMVEESGPCKYDSVQFSEYGTWISKHMYGARDGVDSKHPEDDF